MDMKIKKIIISVLCLFFLFSSIFAEKIGENILYKQERMNPILAPDSDIAKSVTEFWEKTYNKKPIFVAEMLYEIPSNGASIKDVSKILRSFSTMEGIEYYSNSRKKYDVLYNKCYTISDLETLAKIEDNVDDDANGLKLYMLQNDNSFGETPYEVTCWQSDSDVALNVVNKGPLFVKFIKAVKPEDVCLTLYAKVANEKIIMYILAQADFASIPMIETKIKDSLTARIEALFNWFEGQYNEIK